MADLSKILEPALSGLLAGGASAATTLLTFARDLRKRLTDVEAKIGSSEDPRTGLFHTVSNVEESLKRLKRDVENWDEDPPEWAKRLVSRTRSTSSMSLDHLLEVEQRLDQKVRTFHDRLKGFEDALESLSGQIKRLAVDLEEDEKPNIGKLVTREEYERDSRQKTEDLLKVRESLATANGLLRGVMAAMGYLDEKPKDPRTR